MDEVVGTGCVEQPIKLVLSRPLVAIQPAGIAVIAEANKQGSVGWVDRRGEDVTRPNKRESVTLFEDVLGSGRADGCHPSHLAHDGDAAADGVGSDEGWWGLSRRERLLLRSVAAAADRAAIHRRSFIKLIPHHLQSARVQTARAFKCRLHLFRQVSLRTGVRESGRRRHTRFLGWSP